MHSTLDILGRLVLAALLVAVGAVSSLIGVGALGNLLSDHPDGSVSVYVTTGLGGLLGAIAAWLLAFRLARRL